MLYIAKIKYKTLIQWSNIKDMNIIELLKERQDLQKALENNIITTNEYCSFYHSLSMRIKKINNNN